MAGHRLLSFEVRPLAWALLATLTALGGGLLVAVAPAVAFDLGVVGIAAALIARYPFEALVAILLLRAALPDSTLLSFLVLSGGVVALIVSAPRLPGKRVVVPFLALLFIALIGLPLSPSRDEGQIGPLRLPLLGADYASPPSAELLEWVNLASVLTVFCLAGWAVTTQRRLQALVSAVLLAALVPIFVGLKQLATGETVTRTGSTLASLRGPFTYPNYYAFYLVVILLIAIVAFMEARTFARRALFSGLIAATMVCLFFTYTRSAWIGFAVALVALALLRYRRLLVVAAVAAVMAALVAPGAATQAQKRFGDLTSKSEANDSNSWTWRVDQWKKLVPYGLGAPVTGQGFGSYSRMTVKKFGLFDPRYPTIQQPFKGVFSATGFTAHNDYVKMLVEMGVPGLVLWVLVLGGLVSTAARGRRLSGQAPIASGMLAVSFALMLISVSDNLQGYTVVLMYAFAVCGGLAGLTSHQAGRAVMARSSPSGADTREAEPQIDLDDLKAVCSAERNDHPGPPSTGTAPGTGARHAAGTVMAWLGRVRAAWRR